ncbi:MAG: hypothetical protein IJ848_03290 [Alphaproteobacteria bacterium]|nr:hypothetical protein [Alphaproteobacteria bacterium]
MVYRKGLILLACIYMTNNIYIANCNENIGLNNLVNVEPNNHQIMQNNNINNEQQIQNEIGINDNLLGIPDIFQQNTLTASLQMTTSFEELSNKIKGENDISVKKKHIKDFCDYVFGNGYDNLHLVFERATSSELKIIKEIMELPIFDTYMKNSHFNMETKAGITINEFVNQCQQGWYGDFTNRQQFDSIFDTFFEHTKNEQFMKDVNKFNNTISMIQNYIHYNDINVELKNQLIKLLKDKVKLEKEHIDNLFYELNNKKDECYYNVTKNSNNNEIIKIEAPNDATSWYQLNDLIYPIFYEMNMSNFKYKHLDENFVKLRQYCFNDYYNVYFKSNVQKDISFLNFKLLKKSDNKSENEKKLNNILNNTKQNGITNNDCEWLLNKYAIEPNINFKKKYDDVCNNRFIYDIKLVDNLYKDIDAITENNTLSRVNYKINDKYDQLKLDLFYKLKEQNQFCNVEDTYLLSKVLYLNNV